MLAATYSGSNITLHTVCYAVLCCAVDVDDIQKNSKKTHTTTATTIPWETSNAIKETLQKYFKYTNRRHLNAHSLSNKCNVILLLRFDTILSGLNWTELKKSITTLTSDLLLTLNIENLNLNAFSKVLQLRYRNGNIKSLKLLWLIAKI